MSDWANERGIATEPNIDRFIDSVGGERISQRFPGAQFQNADYIFGGQKILIELKILKTEFGEMKGFLEKEQRLYADMARRFSAGEIIRMEPSPRKFYSDKILELYRAPLSRAVKKANTQIRQTKRALGDESYRGILWLVNDGFRNMGTDLVFALLCRILNGSNSELRALIYVTNHYVQMPGSNYANLLWAPAYAAAEMDELPDFVNWLGSAWGNFLEAETGPFDDRRKGPQLTLTGVRPIR